MAVAMSPHSSKRLRSHGGGGGGDGGGVRQMNRHSLGKLDTVCVIPWAHVQNLLLRKRSDDSSWSKGFLELSSFYEAGVCRRRNL